MEKSQEPWPPPPTAVQPSAVPALRPQRLGLATASVVIGGLALLSVWFGLDLVGGDLADLTEPAMLGGLGVMVPSARAAAEFILLGTLALPPVGLALGLKSRSHRAGLIGAGLCALLLLSGLSYLLWAVTNLAGSLGYR